MNRPTSEYPRASSAPNPPEPSEELIELREANRKLAELVILLRDLVKYIQLR